MKSCRLIFLLPSFGNSGGKRRAAEKRPYHICFLRMLRCIIDRPVCWRFVNSCSWVSCQKIDRRRGTIGLSYRSRCRCSHMHQLCMKHSGAQHLIVNGLLRKLNCWIRKDFLCQRWHRICAFVRERGTLWLEASAQLSYFDIWKLVQVAWWVGYVCGVRFGSFGAHGSAVVSTRIQGCSAINRKRFAMLWCDAGKN